MKIFAYVTIAYWLFIGLAVLSDIDFTLSTVNAVVLLTGFLALAILGFIGAGRACKMLELPNWLRLPAAILSALSVMALGLVVSLVAALGSAVPFDSEPVNYPRADGLICQAQILGGATVSFNRVDLTIIRPFDHSPLALNARLHITLGPQTVTQYPSKKSVRMLSSNNANPTLEFAPFGAPLSSTLGFTPTVQTPCNMHYRMYNLSHELHVARIQAQDQSEKTRL